MIKPCWDGIFHLNEFSLFGIADTLTQLLVKFTRLKRVYTCEICSCLKAELKWSSDFKCSRESKTGDLIEIDATCLCHGQRFSSANPNTIQKNQKSRKSLNRRDWNLLVTSAGIRLRRVLITGIKRPRFPAELDAFCGFFVIFSFISLVFTPIWQNNSSSRISKSFISESPFMLFATVSRTFITVFAMCL